MANTRGNILNRTSYDVHQEIYAKVIGLATSSKEIREKLLHRNIGETKDLFDWTHSSNNPYGSELKKKYNFGDEVSYYNNDTLQNKYNIWGDTYDYSNFTSDVVGFAVTPLNLLYEYTSADGIFDKYGGFGRIREAFSSKYNSTESKTIRSVLNNFLQYDNISHALEQDRIGTVTPNPLGALAGAITTNISNFSGTDTPLGLISNQLYASTLQKGALFNSLRKTPYITNGAYDEFGNNLINIAYLGSIGKIDPDTGRLAYEVGDSIPGPRSYESLTLTTFEEMDAIDVSKDVANSSNARYRNIIRNKGGYMPFDGYKYEAPVDMTLLNTIVNPIAKSRYINVWSEGDLPGWTNSYIVPVNDAIHITIQDTNTGLLGETQKLFSTHGDEGIDTIIGRFHTTGGRDKYHNESTLFQTAVSKYGMSHGRNLLNKQAYENGVSKKTNGYDNPYCRTWTFHKQYNKVSDLISPTSTRIAPVGSDITKCMFSIENLAWKDVSKNNNNLTPEQRGPNGGRIMWFPPYGLDFNETVSVNWNPNEFIGRGEKIYTYTNTERRGTLSFILLVDHPSILDKWKNKGRPVDEMDDEQKLLRFFAGCDTLEIDNVSLSENDNENTFDRSSDKIPYVDNPEVKTIVFYVFFPNNYSGKDESKVEDVITYLSTSYETDNSISNGPIYDGLKWEYPVDNDNLDEVLKYDFNYKNVTNFSLNSNLNNVIKSADFNDATHTFSYIASNKNLFNLVVQNGGLVNSINIKGLATKTGNTTSNEKLSRYRAETIKKWLQGEIGSFVLVNNIKISSDIIDINDEDKMNISGESAKRGRCARVEIKVKSSNVNKSLINGERVNSSNENLTKKQQRVKRKLEKAEERAENKEERLENRAQRQDTRRQNKEERKSKRQEKIDKRRQKWGLDTASEDIKSYEKDIVDNTNVETSAKNIYQRMSNEGAKVVSAIKTDTRKTSKLDVESRYKRSDRESEYFELLQENDNFTYSKIVDKIKYFTPAFHSITPEGFNARLSFLHQCTRQGATIGRTGNDLGVSGNMAFGRPPVCVLKLGDFYNTKILIDSVTITYEDTQWDLNPKEMGGIGIQPLMAKVSLNFVFLGGSDIGAPISRLQNAVSFNYYANQSEYDNRADIGMYNDNNAQIKGTPWLPNSKNTNSDE